MIEAGCFALCLFTRPHSFNSRTPFAFDSEKREGTRWRQAGQDRTFVSVFTEEKPRAAAVSPGPHDESNSRTKPSSQAPACTRGACITARAAPEAELRRDRTGQTEGRLGAQPAPRTGSVGSATGVKGLPCAETDALAQACAWSAAHTRHKAVNELATPETGDGRGGTGAPTRGWGPAGRPPRAQAGVGTCPTKKARSQ